MYTQKFVRKKAGQAMQIKNHLFGGIIYVSKSCH